MDLRNYTIMMDENERKKRVWRKNEKLCFDYNDKEAATFYGYENISLNCDLRVFNTWEADLWSFEAQVLTL